MRSFLKKAAHLGLVLGAACSSGETTSPPPPPPPGPAPVASVILGAMPTVVVGGTAQLGATTRDAQGNVLTGRTITWSSSATAIATVDGAGLATGVAAGTTVITAASEGKNASANLTVSPVPVATVVVTPDTATIGAGRQKTLAAVTRDAAGNDLPGRPVTWSSGNPAVATVEPATGVVTAVAAGQAVITAAVEGKAATATITVVAIPVAAVKVAPTIAVVRLGKDTVLAASARDEADEPLPGRAIAWTSSAPAIATVDPVTGKVTAVAVGSAIVTATSEGKSGTANVTVVAAAVATVTVTPANSILELAKTAPLGAVLKDDEGKILGNRVITWSTSDAAVATVDTAGVVTAVESGSAVITATSEGVSGIAFITVVAPVASVEILPALDTLEAYETRALAVRLRDAKGRLLTGREVTWTTSNGAIASVDQDNAILTGVDRGTVTITVTSEGIADTATRVVVIRYRQLALGTMHACDLASGGIAWCWGLNGAEGRIGDAAVGNDMFRNEPFRVPGDHRFVRLSGFARHTCGIDADGQAWCWGYNGWGGLGDGSNSSSSFTPVRVAGNHTWADIAVGADHTCGIEFHDRTVYCWGHNDWRQFGVNTPALATAPVLAAGGKTFASIAAGGAFTCGVALDGVSYCWGANTLGQLGDGKPVAYANVFTVAPTAVVGGRAFAQLSMGSTHSCGVTTGGQAYCWGSSTSGRLGTGGGDTSTPTAVAGGLSFVRVSAGSNHSCGVTTGGEAYCWGANSNGQLGFVAVNGSTTPQRAGGTGMLVAEVAAAGIGTGNGAHSCGVAKDRLTVYCWGRNDVGQLGNGATTGSTIVNATPAIVVGQKPLP